MLDELKSERIVNKVGGRFKLAALIQKRMGELLQGGRPLIEDAEDKTMLEIVVQEILQDKITIEGLPDGESASQQANESQGGDSAKAGKSKI
jgi:DNA-directed RNA polymerase subunit K/omega